MEHSGDKLDKSEIIELCHGYGWGTMFALSDAIVAMNMPVALDILHRLKETSKVDAWIPGFIGTLRNHLYIKYLQHLGTSESNTSKLLQKDVYKWYKTPISYAQLKKLYTKLVKMSVADKRGKWLQDSELWRILAIELALLDLQKSKNL